MQRFIQLTFTGAAVAILVACGGGSAPPDSGATSSQRSANNASSRLSGMSVPGGSMRSLDARLARAKGPVSVWVSLTEPSVAAYQSGRMAALGAEMQPRALAAPERARALGVTELAQRNELGSHRALLQAKQHALMANLGAMGANELARVHTAHNAIAISVDAASLPAIAMLPGVAKVRPVLNYRLDLSETVPYVGAATVQAAGKDGRGVRVAVLDSGVDYTHRNLGGAGTLAAYEAAYGTATTDPRNTTRDGLFPTAKVIDGFDFVGETWGVVGGVEVGTRTEDPDPIDFGGHGTHVADIIGGRSADGLHKGVAPGASLVAVKVCSSISTSCNGIALLKAMDFALDPNGDGDTRDAVDVINMSLGSDYGQIEDDLSFASSNAVKLGVIVVAAAGNGANKPYVAGSPATAVGVIGVAQTEVPSAKAPLLQVTAPASIARNLPAIFQPWSVAPLTVIQAPVQYGDGAGGNRNGCAAFAAGSLAGKIGLVDRGACNFTLKIKNIGDAGGVAGIIGLVNADEPFSGGDGGDRPITIPGYMISLADASLLRSGLPATVVKIDPNSNVALVGSMTGSSSRGPAYSTQHIKPEIGAPGASVSAEVGTGTGETAFGGTSGATPMVSGAAAILVQAFPRYSPERIKALLMNSAETAIFTNPATQPGVLAPVSRIGAGELRVNRALAQTTLAWNRETRSAALSFGALEVAQKTTVERKLRIENHSHVNKSFNVVSTFRFADDAASGAVQVVAPGRVNVSAQDSEDIEVKLIIDPTKLPEWTLNGGLRGGNGALLNGPEYDGYLTLTAGAEKISVPWHVLPRKAADTEAELSDSERGKVALKLRNRGAEAGDYDLFSLTGTSKRIPSDQLPQPGDSIAVVDMRAVGVRHLSAADFGADYLEFAISTQGRRAHPNYPAEFDILIDTNGDGIDDFVAFNFENGGFGASGQNVVALVNLATGDGEPVFFADADLNSGNIIFTVPMNDSTGQFNLGVQLGQTIGFSVLALDNYFRNFVVTDEIVGMRFTPGMSRFNVGNLPFGSVAPRSSAKVEVTTVKVPSSASTESGVLVMHRRNAAREANALRADD